MTREYLPDEKHRELLAAARRGDQGARERLFRELIRVAAMAMRRVHVPEEEITGLAALAVDVAIRTYRPERGTKVRTWVYYTARYQGMKWLQGQERDPIHQSTEWRRVRARLCYASNAEYSRLTGDERMTLEEATYRLAGAATVVPIWETAAWTEPEPLHLDHRPFRERLAEALERDGLKPREREALLLVFADGMSCRRAAAELGVTQQNVSQLRERALRKIRRNPKLREAVVAACEGDLYVA